jgi:hypothetical protein
VRYFSSTAANSLLCNVQIEQNRWWIWSLAWIFARVCHRRWQSSWHQIKKLNVNARRRPKWPHRWTSSWQPQPKKSSPEDEPFVNRVVIWAVMVIIWYYCHMVFSAALSSLLPSGLLSGLANGLSIRIVVRWGCHLDYNLGCQLMMLSSGCHLDAVCSHLKRPRLNFFFLNCTTVSMFIYVLLKQIM